MKKLSGIFAILAAVIFWGVSFLSIDAVLTVIDPIVLGFFRYFLAVLFVLALAFLTKMDFRITKRDLFVFFLAGFLGIFLYSIFENSSMLYISAGTASILVSLTPMAMLLGNRMIFGERIRIRQGVLILVSIAGVFFVVYRDGIGDGAPDAWIGYLFMALSIVFGRVYSLIVKKAGMKYDSLKVTTIQSIMALFIFLPTLLFRPFPDFAALTPELWMHLIFLGVFCSGVSYYLYVHAVNVLGVTLPNVFINFVPLFTVLTNVLVFGGSIDVLTVVGGVIIVAAMTLLTFDMIRNPVA